MEAAEVLLAEEQEDPELAQRVMAAKLIQRI